MGIRYYFNTLYLNNKCILFPIFQLAIITCLIIYIIINRNDDLILQIAESILTCFFFLEILIKIFIQKENYLLNNNNITDIIIFTSIVSLMIIQKTILIQENQENELLSIALLLIRYIIQSVRLLVNIKINRQTIQFIENNDITFTNEASSQQNLELNQ